MQAGFGGRLRGLTVKSLAILTLDGVRLCGWTGYGNDDGLSYRDSDAPSHLDRDWPWGREADFGSAVHRLGNTKSPRPG